MSNESQKPQENKRDCEFETPPYSDYVPIAFKELNPGTILANKYEIIKKIKSGGMGSVYKAKVLASGDICAVKELMNLALSEQEHQVTISRFKREASILSNLKHPSMPCVIDYFSSTGKYYLVMEFIDGKDLSTILEQRGQSGLPEAEVVEWTKQICDVLIYLHTREPLIVYRDIKPSNIMIRKDNKAILIDFGIARTLQTMDDISRTKTAIGTFGYMSPEQYRGKPEPRSDIYSLGATMYHLLTGNQPIPFSLPSFSKEKPDISEEIKAAVMTSVRFKPDERFKSASEMKKALTGTIKKDVPASSGRGLKTSKTSRNMEDPFLGLDSKKIICMAKGAKDNRIVEYLINILLSDPMDENRRSAASALGDLGDKRAVPSLIMALGQDDEYVRTNAAWALGRMGDTSAVEVLFQLYEEDTSKTVKNGVQKSLINLASKKQGGEVVLFLLSLIEQASYGYKDILPVNHSLYFASLKELLIEFMKDPDRLRVRFHLGILYYYDGAINDSMIHFERAYRLQKDNPEILFFIGKIHHEKKEFYKAIKAYEDALKLDVSIDVQDALIKAYFDFAREHADRGLINEECDYYNKIISTMPEHSETNFFRGLLHIKQNKPREAVKYFTRYIEENPQGNWAIEASELLENLQSNLFFKIFSGIKGIFNKK